MPFPSMLETSPIQKAGLNPTRNQDSRNSARESGEFRGTIYFKDADDFWEEEIIVTSISKNGAGFQVSSPCPIARLVILALDMPKHLRVYDHDEERYPIVGVVQQCNILSDDDRISYYVGVALIGTRVPASFRQNPLQSYRITGMAENGLWNISECARQFQPRRDPRFLFSCEVALTLLDENRPGNYKALASTQDVSARGASVVCTLEVKTGARVKFACNQFDFFAVAIVRNRTRTVNGPLLHLEFVDALFPIEKLMDCQLLADPADGGRSAEPVQSIPTKDAPSHWQQQ